jgi:hypothetical protein
MPGTCINNVSRTSWVHYVGCHWCAGLFSLPHECNRVDGAIIFFVPISAGFDEIRNGEGNKTYKYTAHILLKA